MWITPYHEDTAFSHPFSICDKITIFYEQVDGWQLRIAELVINGGTDAKNKFIPPIEGAGYGALYIVLSYFEMIAKYMDGYVPPMTSTGKRGPGKSEEYFNKGVYVVFPSLKQSASSYPKEVAHSLKLLYEEVRCGLYHAGVAGKGIVLTGDIPGPILFDGATLQVIINPHLLVPALRRNLVSYVVDLKKPENKDLREKFQKRFDYDHAI